ncbi:DEKNAAC105076 [Brettanomyces naardenensis]|uniref:DEKNAAC105076 n=1 Tax=Brettanomyces naardenensis TaxID=13370 RepID=A0A448YSM1_BRENA|nr:DEKNAAC105076 [Brettanomyces naardenensis]
MGLVYAEHFKTSQDLLDPNRRHRKPHYRASSDASSHVLSPSLANLVATSPTSVSSYSSSDSSGGYSVSTTMNTTILPPPPPPPQLSSSSYYYSGASPGRGSLSFLLDSNNKALLIPPLGTETGYEDSNGVDDQSLHILRCKRCHNHICLNKLVISTNFYGNYGPALFVSKVLNVKLSDNRDSKKMRTGKYEVRGIYCRQCNVNLGWKYLYSEEDGEKYKEGKYVVEKTLLEEVGN